MLIGEQAPKQDHALHEHLNEATYLATLMVDQVEWVDVLDPHLSREIGKLVREDGDFCLQASQFIRQPRQRDTLKRIVEAHGRQIARNALALRMVNPEEVIAAAELVTESIKGLLVVAQDRTANAWLRERRLCVKFTSIEAPYYQDR